MVNIKDVAKLANVSVATVSRYLNQNGYVSKQAKEKIEKAIHELDYRPNQIARSLSKRQSQLIGLIVPDIQNPYFPQLARAIEDTALRYDYTVVLCNTDETVEKEQLYMNRLSQNYVAGLLVATNAMDVKAYEEIDIPIVALDRLIDSNIPTVMTDNFGGAKKGTAHLIECGAKNLLCLRGPKNVKAADERERGFYAAIEGTDSKGKTVLAGFDFNEASSAIMKALSEDSSIDGIFASSDAVAIAAIKMIQTLNKQVPNDIQVVGFDGIELGKMISPELTTVSQDIYQIGQYATKMLIEQIEGNPLKNQQIIVETNLIVRGTTRKGTKK